MTIYHSLLCFSLIPLIIAFHSIARILIIHRLCPFPSAGTFTFPINKLVETVIAASCPDSVGAEGSIRIQRNDIAAVLIAEDVSTSSAMMASCRQGKGFLARWCIAEFCLGIGLKRETVSNYLHTKWYEKVEEGGSKWENMQE